MGSGSLLQSQDSEGWGRRFSMSSRVACYKVSSQPGSQGEIYRTQAWRLCTSTERYINTASLLSPFYSECSQQQYVLNILTLSFIKIKKYQHFVVNYTR